MSKHRYQLRTYLYLFYKIHWLQHFVATDTWNMLHVHCRSFISAADHDSFLPDNRCERNAFPAVRLQKWGHICLSVCLINFFCELRADIFCRNKCFQILVINMKIDYSSQCH